MSPYPTLLAHTSVYSVADLHSIQTLREKASDLTIYFRNFSKFYCTWLHE